ncbi:DUF1385 domain-containing protein [Candidatus Woesearchaeota archaeon]|nr:DUF1385 domain-containing protein [Candidatus Woesearchaeota archaeon]
MVKSYLGGQALIEGVLIKNKNKISIAVRKTNGKIIVKKEKLRFKDNNIPFIRGILNLFIILYIGIKSLNFSSNVQLNKEDKLSVKEIIISLLFALGFGILIFKLTPLLAANFIDKKFGINNFYFNIIDGLLKILLFVAYVYIISLSKDVKRVFQYHGAEHKAVACHEDSKKLTIENVQKYSPVHKRCGTTFVFLVLLVSILVYSFIPKDWSILWKFILRILLLPVIAGLSYEILRLGAKHKFMKIFIYPGLWIQKITTQEPDNKQVEVAIKAVKGAL